MRCIHPIHIEGRIGFRVAKVLRLLQNVIKRPATLAHGGEDVIAGPIQNTVHALDTVGDQAVAQRADDRNAARNRRFVGKRNTASLRPARQGGTVMG